MAASGKILVTTLFVQTVAELILLVNVSCELAFHKLQKTCLWQIYW